MHRRYSHLLAGIVLAAALGTAAAAAAELAAADYTPIQQLYARYNTAIDRGDADAWADTFTADGVFASNFKGREALKGFENDWRTSPQMNGAARRHFAADLVITPSAEGATATVSAILVDLSTRPASIANFVSYNDVLVKTAQGWRFKSRAVAPQTAPAATPAPATPAPPAR
jgi:ketosteroid isomerase-like protein